MLSFILKSNRPQESSLAELQWPPSSAPVPPVPCSCPLSQLQWQWCYSILPSAQHRRRWTWGPGQWEGDWGRETKGKVFLAWLHTSQHPSFNILLRVKVAPNLPPAPQNYSTGQVLPVIRANGQKLKKDNLQHIHICTQYSTQNSLLPVGWFKRKLQILTKRSHLSFFVKFCLETDNKNIIFSQISTWFVVSYHMVLWK